MKRPYFRYSFEDLRQLFENSRNDGKALQTVLDELEHRKKPRALALKRVVEDLLNKGNQIATNEGSSSDLDGSQNQAGKETTGFSNASRSVEKLNGDGGSGPASEKPAESSEQAFSHDFLLVEPIGTAVGHPQKRIFPLKDEVRLEFTPETSRSRRYATALRKLIDELRSKRAGFKTIQLENGNAVPVEGPQWAYQFEQDDTTDLFEGASVVASIGSQKCSGSIVAVMQGSLIVGLDRDFGDQITVCVLSVDNTAMLEALAKRLEHLDEAGATGFNTALANAVVTNNLSKTGEPAITSVSITGVLSERQQAAVRMALENDISFIWGPPGTGKTRSLTELTRILFENEKRILICSNTNQAVDQVLLKLCETLGVAHDAVDGGAIIRIGRIANERLDQDWSPYVTVSGIVGRKSVGLRKRLTELENQVRPIREMMTRIDRLLALLDHLDAKKQEERQLASSSEAAQKNLNTLYHTVDALAKRLSTLEDELRKLKEAGLFRRAFMRTEEAIVADRQKVAEEKARTEGKVETAKRESSNAQEASQRALNRIAELEKQIPPGAGPRKEQETRRTELENNLQPLLGEIAAINKKLADMEATVVQEARIVGATVTKTYLSPKQFVGFDAVIVDEASMVILPALYYTAGLARERVVISGDFRQLPPIVQTDQRELFEAIGRDVFWATGITKSVESGGSPPKLVMLDTQYRMQMPICDLISSAMYQGRLKTQRDAMDFGDRPPRPFDQTLTIIDTSKVWPFVNRDAFGSHYNLMHALAIRNLCLHLHEQGFVSGPGDVGVATPYSAQAKLLRRILKGSGLERIISAGTVHRYQGDEKRLMILDIPDSLGEPTVGIFLEADNPQDKGAPLFNVGITRARDHLVVFANLTYLQNKLPDRALLRDVLYCMQSGGQIVDIQDVLALRPVMNDLKHFQSHSELELNLEDAGLFRQKEFEAVCTVDIDSAQKSVAVFSGFVTPTRVAAYGDLFRRKLSEGVTIRCVTRPPKFNGSIPKEEGRKALDTLQGLGCVVDTRARIHEKIVIIDDKIVWFGSLNMLSHTARTDEMMMRIDNADAAKQVAIFMALRKMSSGENGEGLSVKKENPECPQCWNRTYYAKGRNGPFWACEQCGWTASFDKPVKPSKSTPIKATSAHNQAEGDPKCPKCGLPMVRRAGPRGPFLGCSRFPNCKGTRPLPKKHKA